MPDCFVVSRGPGLHSGKVSEGGREALVPRYALKRIHKLKVQAKVLKQLTAEVEIYLMLDHPHIAALRLTSFLHSLFLT